MKKMKKKIKKKLEKKLMAINPDDKRDQDKTTSTRKTSGRGEKIS